MKKILIIGKNSFLAKNFIMYLKNKIKYNAISHKQINKISFRNYSHVINFAISPAMIKKNIKKEKLIDFKIFQKIKKYNSILIFLNTRRIYKPAPNIKEGSQIYLKNFYEKNKYKLEKNLQQNLTNRFLSLRISNVIGQSYNSKKRVHKTFLDHFIDYKKSNKKIIVENNFKDFITTEQFSEILLKLILKNIVGIFNVSIGRKVFTKDIIRWLDPVLFKNFLFKKTNLNKSFYLNNKKLKKNINIEIFYRDLRYFVSNIFDKNK